MQIMVLHCQLKPGAMHGPHALRLNMRDKVTMHGYFNIRNACISCFNVFDTNQFLCVKSVLLLYLYSSCIPSILLESESFIINSSWLKTTELCIYINSDEIGHLTEFLWLHCMLSIEWSFKLLFKEKKIQLTDMERFQHWPIQHMKSFSKAMTLPIFFVFFFLFTWSFSIYGLLCSRVIPFVHKAWWMIKVQHCCTRKQCNTTRNWLGASFVIFQQVWFEKFL